MRLKFLCLAILIGGSATFPPAQGAGLISLTGSELIAKLNQPETCAAAFAELYRRTEPGKDSRHVLDYLNPEVIVCPQPNEPSIYLVLCDHRYESRSKDDFEIKDMEKLFGGASTSSRPPPVEKWRKDRVIFGFSANGEKLMPFGGWNMVDGYLFDLNRDGVMERAEKQAYSAGKDGKTIEFLRVERVARESVPLLTVAINRGDERDWGWAMQKEADGSYAFAVGPKDDGPSRPEEGEAGFRLKSIAAVFRWNAEHDRFEGPAGSAAEHFILVGPGEDIFERARAVGSGPPFPSGAAVATLTSTPTPVAVATLVEKWRYVSLREKSDEELVTIMTAGKDANQAEREAIVPTHLPAHFWELTPKDAALALVEANRSPENRAACQIALDDADGVAPPGAGEVGFEWKDSACMAVNPGAGRTTLVYQPGRSRCSLAQVIVEARVSPLAQRGRGDVFDLTMALLRKENSSSAGRALGGASLLVSQYPKFRERVRAFLEEALHDIARSRLEASALFDAIWVGRFTELTPILENLATASPNEIASRRSSGSGTPFDPAAARFHEARRILTAWQEDDPLTQIKLFALLEGNTYREERLPSLLGPLHDHLLPGQRQVFRNFLAWIKDREEQNRPVFISKVERIEALLRECERAEQAPR